MSYDFINKRTGRPYDHSFTYHSIRRSSQRGINEDDIKQITRYGRVIRKQGLRFFYMTGSELRFMPLGAQDKLKNLVIVMAGSEDVVITAYKNKDAIRNIKRKSKRLIKN